MKFKTIQRLRRLFRLKPKIFTTDLNRWNWAYKFKYRLRLVTKVERIKRLRRRIGRTTFRKDVFTRVTKLTNRVRCL